jgi:hypothetical protein
MTLDDQILDLLKGNPMSEYHVLAKVQSTRAVGTTQVHNALGRLHRENRILLVDGRWALVGEKVPRLPADAKPAPVVHSTEPLAVDRVCARCKERQPIEQFAITQDPGIRRSVCRTCCAKAISAGQRAKRVRVDGYDPSTKAVTVAHFDDVKFGDGKPSPDVPEYLKSPDSGTDHYAAPIQSLADVVEKFADPERHRSSRHDRTDRSRALDLAERLVALAERIVAIVEQPA